jgi:transcription initiation factor TFIID subunit TAF12
VRQSSREQQLPCKKKQLAAAVKVAQEVTKKVRDAEKTERLVAARAQKQQKRNAANTQKSLQLFQRGKRAASQKAVPKAKRTHCAVVVQDGVEAAEAAPPVLPKQLRTRTIKAPDRYSE